MFISTFFFFGTKEQRQHSILGINSMGPARLGNITITWLDQCKKDGVEKYFHAMGTVFLVVVVVVVVR